MSVLNKFKNIIEAVEEFPKEKSQIILTENHHADIENYRLLKLFERDRAIVTFDSFELCITGENLTVEYFSPSRLAICGNIKSVSYMWDFMQSGDEL